AGGTLGNDLGGFSSSDDESIRITAISVLDSGQASSEGGNTAVDVSQGTCGTNCDDVDNTCTAEPFYDTRVSIKVVNNTRRNVRFTSLRYIVPESTGTGTSSFTSDTIRFIGESTATAQGGEATLTALVYNASGGGKSFFGSSSDIPATLGFRNVTFIVTGTTLDGETVTVRGTTILSFGDFNNC
ncbi:MAG: hypothetical protein KDD42_05675, partial [Bdellovibrionales bacterium]|nr:hypothetical protein [Bdellovibrionales bacterium]